MKEMTVEEMTELIRVTVRDTLSKHKLGTVTPEGKEIIKNKVVETINDLQARGVIQIVIPEKSDQA